MVEHEVGGHCEQDVASNSAASEPAGLWFAHLGMADLLAPRAQVGQRRTEPFARAEDETIVAGSDSVPNLPTGLVKKALVQQVLAHRVQAQQVLAHRVQVQQMLAQQMLAHRVQAQQVKQQRKRVARTQHSPAAV